MDAEHIKEVLADWNYDRALALYLPYAPAALKPLLKQCNSFTTKKLKEGLRNLLDTAKQHNSSTQPAVSVPLNSVVSRSKSQEYHQSPLAVQAKISERLHLVKEAQVLKEKLPLMDDLERRDAVFKIDDNFLRIQEIWDELNYYETHGILPPEETEQEVTIPEDLGQLQRRFLTLRTYKSKKLSTWPKYVKEFEAIENTLKSHGIIH